jgi:hypothetical protein
VRTGVTTVEHELAGPPYLPSSQLKERSRLREANFTFFCSWLSLFVGKYEAADRQRAEQNRFPRLVDVNGFWQPKNVQRFMSGHSCTFGEFWVGVTSEESGECRL